MGETTGSAWIGACRDAVMGCGIACRDAVMEGTMDVTIGPVCCDVACCDAVLGGTVDVTTGPYHGEACLDAFLGGTVGVTTSPVLHVIDTVGVTTSLYLAILCCDATMLVLGGDIVGETTDSLIMSLYSP